MDACHTKSPHLYKFTRITGFLLSNAYLACFYFQDKTLSSTNLKMTLSNPLLNFTSASTLTRASLETAEEITISYETKKIDKKSDRGRCFYCKNGPHRTCMLPSYLCLMCDLPMCSPKIKQDMF